MNGWISSVGAAAIFDGIARMAGAISDLEQQHSGGVV
jgi:hypothetical protein